MFLTHKILRGGDFRCAFLRLARERIPHALKTEKYRFLLSHHLKYVSILTFFDFKNTKFFFFKVEEFLPTNFLGSEA